jgi:hypothetical protein
MPIISITIDIDTKSLTGAQVLGYYARHHGIEETAPAAKANMSRQFREAVVTQKRLEDKEAAEADTPDDLVDAT